MTKRKIPGPVTEKEVDAMLKLSRLIDPTDVPPRAYVRARLELRNVEEAESAAKPTNDPKCPGCGFLASEHRKEAWALVWNKAGNMLEDAKGPVYVCPKPKRKRGRP